MKRLLLSLTLLTFFSGNAQTLLSENFEGTTFPPTGWTRSNTNATRPWDFTTVNFDASGQAEYTISGAKSASVNWIGTANTAILTSPSFSLAGTTAPVLRFKVVVGYSYMIVLDAGDLFAEISTNGGTTWTTLWTEDTEPGFLDDNDGDDDSDLYNQNIVSVEKSLAAYAGQTNVLIRFRYVATDADIVSIDDVQVLTSGTLATNEAAAKSQSLTIFPNPTKGEINIKADKKVKSSSIIDLSGKTVWSSTSERPDISNLPKGNYLIKVEFADGTAKTQKLIKD